MPVAGYATVAATRAFHQLVKDELPEVLSEFSAEPLLLSSLGMGTFPGAADFETDARIAEIVHDLICHGVNVFDTSAHYRYGHSLTALAAGLRVVFQQGHASREALFLISKGGFLSFAGGPPPDFESWFAREIAAKGLGNREELVNNNHLLSPPYLRYQIQLSRRLLDVQTLDAFVIDQPEVHIPRLGKEKFYQQLLACFIMLEQQVAAGHIRYYGISSFDGFRVATDHSLFLSLSALHGLALKAIQGLQADAQASHFRLLQLPYNPLMPEAFTRFNQTVGQGEHMSTLQAAFQLGIFVMGSHALMKGRLAGEDLQLLPALNPVQQLLQFNRSTPGLGCSLVGISQPKHTDDVKVVLAKKPLGKNQFFSLFQRA